MSWKCYSITKCVKTVHRVVVTLEPWGVLVAILALAFAFYEFRSDRNIREATLWVMVAERLEAARSAKRPVARVGQVPVLEAVVRSKLGLRNVDLSEIFLKDAQLQEAELSGAILTGARLVNTNLAHSHLRDAFASEVIFYKVDLSDADFTDAYLGQAQFASGTLERANFTSADLENTRFASVKLNGADFTGAEFLNTRFVKVDLRQAKGLPDKIIGACEEESTLPPNKFIKRCETAVLQDFEICE